MSKLCGNCGGIGCETVACQSCGGSGKRSDEQRLNAKPTNAVVVSGDWRERMDEAIERRIEAFSNGSCFDEQLAIIAEIDSLLDEAVTMPEPTRFVIIPETDENDYQALSLRDSRFPEHPFCRIHASEALQLAAALIKASKETPPADRSGG